MRCTSLLTFTALIAGCQPTTVSLREPPPPESRPDPGLTVPQDVDEATAETEVPSELLLAIGQAETRLQMVVGQSEFDGQEPAYGMMALRGPMLYLAADLAGLDPEDVKYDFRSNVLASAHLLAAGADEMGIDSSDIDAWAPVVARYAGIEDEEATAEYVHHQVYQALRDGIAVEGYKVEPMDVHPDWPLPAIDAQRSTEPGTVWSASPNYSSRSGANVDFVIIHTCEGSYSGCWGWLTNSSSGVSAHYVVKEDGSEVRALVDENNKAWHISANYDCDNNSDVECWRDGTAMNGVSVGIEHAGYASQSSWHSGLLARSAELTCGITDRNTVPRDAYHVVAHGQLQPWNRVDPGPNWPWADYLEAVQTECGDPTGGGGGGGGTGTGGGGGGGGGTPTGGAVVIESNNAANDTDSFYVELSSNWWSSTNVSGYYNTGYWVASTASVSDPASFWFYTDTAQCWTVDAWWTSASDRPSAIAYVGWDSADHEVGRSTVSQRTNGGKWNTLGTWSFGTGWNRVLLSRWASTGSYVIADAVRVTPTTCN